MNKFLLFTYSIYDQPFQHAWDCFKLDFDSKTNALLHLINHESIMDGAQIVDIENTVCYGVYTPKIVGRYERDYTTRLWEVAVTAPKEIDTILAILEHEKNHYYHKKLSVPFKNDGSYTLTHEALKELMGLTSIGDGGLIW